MADTAGQSTDAVERLRGAERLRDAERLRGAERLRDLETRATGYEFFAALRLIECAAPNAPRLGRSARAADDPVRLGQVPSMAFAPAMFAEAARLKDGHLWLGGAFFGLFGPNGPLPLHLTEYALGRRHNFRDPAMARFADIFHHRLLCLFYRGWADTQPTVHGDRPASDRFKMYAGALAGIGQPALRERDAMPDAAKLHHAGYLSAQVRNPEALCAMLAEFFGEQVRIEEFRGEWMRLSDEDRLYLGRSKHFGTLASTATLGGQVWGAHSRFRVVLGSMPFERFERFLPGSVALEQLRAIVRNFVGLELAWDLQLLVDRAQVPGIRLGSGARLGWSSWLAAQQRTCDADDVILADGALN